MDYRFEFVTFHCQLWIVVSTLLFIYLVLKRHRQNLPPGPWGLPIVGYLPFLGDDPHLELHKLAKKYGDVFGLNLGLKYVVVVADYALAKEFLNKASTADRPKDAFLFMPDGIGLGELNGSDWTEQRRYTVNKMKSLGFGKSHWEELVQVEMLSLVEEISQAKGQPIDISKSLSVSITNNVLSLVLDHHLPQGHPNMDVIQTGVESFQTIYQQSGIISFFPKLFRIAVKLGFIRVGKKLESMANMNKCLKQDVEDIKNTEDNKSYISEYLKEIEKNRTLDTNSSYNERNLLGNVQVLIFAGSDTTKVSIIWLFLAMASFPDIQDKVHQEVDSILGKDGDPVTWMDRQRLPYCYATIMEGQRWRTIGPLNVLHKTNSDTKIRDYVIPKDSNIITLIWAFHNDERNWAEPESFRPERFLDHEGNVLQNMANFAPFGVGKRLCIGETVAYITMFLYFVGVMRRFKILPANEKTSPNIKGCLGLNLQPINQQLRYIKR